MITNKNEIEEWLEEHIEEHIEREAHAKFCQETLRFKGVPVGIAGFVICALVLCLGLIIIIL